MKKAEAEAETPRPPCSGCGKPATQEVVVETHPLVLERDAGVRSQPYWKGSYHGSCRITTMLCDGCMKSSVKVELTVAATITGTKIP